MSWTFRVGVAQNGWGFPRGIPSPAFELGGVAVLQGGTWKVGDASFCGLLTLENGGRASGLPAACHSAG